MDFNAYLASSSDDEEPQEGDENTNEDHDSSDDEDKNIDKYKVGFPLYAARCCALLSNG